MAIIRAAVGDNLRDFGEATELADVWAFINEHLALADTERAVVLMDDSGETLGQLWDSSLYFAHWGSPAKMRAYFDLAGFDHGT
jgi:hypothetical protein